MKIFVITPRIPFPIDKGDKLRAFHFLRLLKDNNRIILFSLDYENKAPNKNKIKEICDHFYVHKISLLQAAINVISAPFRKLPFQVSLFYSKSTEKKIKNVIAEHKPDVILCQLIRTAPLVINIKDVPKILDYVDVISEGLKRRRKESNLFLKFFLNIEYKSVREYESRMFNLFDKKIIITEQDKKCLPVKSNDNLYVVPNGVDTDYFKPIDSDKEYDLIFTGNMSYPPNILAANLIAKQILPLLEKKYPDIKVLILGANPSKKVLSLKSENIEVVGWVDDIRHYYSKAKVFVAPLVIGTGLQNKLLEAMSMGLPSVTTALVWNGINAPINDTLIVAETAEEFARAITSLLENPELATRIGNNARQYIIDNYNWDIVRTKLNDIVHQ